MEECAHDQTTEICGCGLTVGAMQLRHGLLYDIDAQGRLHIRAPRRADVTMARRVVATMAGASDDVTNQLTAGLTSIREKS